MSRHGWQRINARRKAGAAIPTQWLIETAQTSTGKTCASSWRWAAIAGTADQPRDRGAAHHVAGRRPRREAGGATARWLHAHARRRDRLGSSGRDGGGRAGAVTPKRHRRRPHARARARQRATGACPGFPACPARRTHRRLPGLGRRPGDRPAIDQPESSQGGHRGSRRQAGRRRPDRQAGGLHGIRLLWHGGAMRCRRAGRITHLRELQRRKRKHARGHVAVPAVSARPHRVSRGEPGPAGHRGHP